MNRAERRRAERDSAVPPCPFPQCTGKVQPGSEYGACAGHTKMVKDVLFILDHTRKGGQPVRSAGQPPASKPAGSKIILPGTRAFQEEMKRV